MRVIGFSKKWDKLQQPEFTTVRFPRKDKDWFVGEQVQIVYHNRSKDREILAYAEIISKEVKTFNIGEANSFTDAEAQADGFVNNHDMRYWFLKTYGNHLYDKPIHKLTLRVIARFSPQPNPKQEGSEK